MCKKLEYSAWRDWFAQRCSKCKGSKFVEHNGIPGVCFCQIKATYKFRLEQVDVVPYSLKYTTWEDFTGLIKKDREIEGALTTQSALLGRNAAFRYCFNADYEPGISKSLDKLKVHNNLSSGVNVVISGPPNSGKTLLAVLILKEVNKTIFIGRDLEYRWTRFFDIIQAASWAPYEKNIEYGLLDQYAELDFLFIDGVYIPKGGHNAPPDHSSINAMFGHRSSLHKPTILICSKEFSNTLKTNPDFISSIFGEEFLKVASHPDNVVIDLEKANG